MMGALFAGHPWGEAPVKLDDPNHPLLKAFEGKGFWVRDEMYKMREPYAGLTIARNRILLQSVGLAPYLLLLRIGAVNTARLGHHTSLLFAIGLAALCTAPDGTRFRRSLTFCGLPKKLTTS